jgi:predicted TIM-barrel enzyme
VAEATWESIAVGGWFGSDGQSAATNDIFTGWFTGSPPPDERLMMLIDLLKTKKPIFINSNGNLENLKIDF